MINIIGALEVHFSYHPKKKKKSYILQGRFVKKNRLSGGEGEGLGAHLVIGQKSREIPYTIGAFCEEKSTFGGKSAR